MNKVILIGRLTNDVDLKYTGGQMAVAKFTLAVDRMKNNETDFIRVTVFGKQGENAEKYLSKGKKTAIEGRIQTGSYEKDGKKVYTTDVIADRVEFIEWGDKASAEDKPSDSFSQIDEDIPWM